ncbi:MAG: 1,2-phenylacetyl-CoA epoxidase subunit B [Acidimicrobiia bacterium]
MKTYEVFLKKPGKSPFEHAGSFKAPDREMAMVLARETYTRRAEGEQMWLVARDDIVEVEWEFIEPNADKPHRTNDGSIVAALRKQRREGTDE